MPVSLDTMVFVEWDDEKDDSKQSLEIVIEWASPAKDHFYKIIHYLSFLNHFRAESIEYFLFEGDTLRKIDSNVEFKSSCFVNDTHNDGRLFNDMSYASSDQKYVFFTDDLLKKTDPGDVYAFNSDFELKIIVPRVLLDYPLRDAIANGRDQGRFVDDKFCEY